MVTMTDSIGLSGAFISVYPSNIAYPFLDGVRDVVFDSTGRNFFAVTANSWLARRLENSSDSVIHRHSFVSKPIIKMETNITDKS